MHTFYFKICTLPEYFEYPFKYDQYKLPFINEAIALTHPANL